MTTEMKEFQCDMCSGVGANGWEDPCEKCGGEGVAMEETFHCGCRVDDESGCDEEDCTIEAEKQQAYWAARYTNERPYSKEEVLDAYSDPCEAHKRDSLLRDLEG